MIPKPQVHLLHGADSSSILLQIKCAWPRHQCPADLTPVASSPSLAVAEETRLREAHGHPNPASRGRRAHLRSSLRNLTGGHQEGKTSALRAGAGSWRGRGHREPQARPLCPTSTALTTTFSGHCSVSPGCSPVWTVLLLLAFERVCCLSPCVIYGSHKTVTETPGVSNRRHLMEGIGHAGAEKAQNE